MSEILHVSLAFAKLPDPGLDEFTSGVITKLTGNAAFPDLPVAILDLSAGQLAFQKGITATVQGGTQATAIKEAARLNLLDMLRQEAAYVQLKSKNDRATLLSSGFEINNPAGPQLPLDKPTIQAILNEASTQLVVRGSVVTNAHAYEAQIKNGTGGWQPAGTFTQSRRMILTSLTPGQTYTVQIRAVGGSTGYSDWSDPVSHMAM